MRIIAIANQKGGCGKTTVAINLSASIAREGRRTLLIDLDPQGHCALGMAVPDEQIDLSIHDCLMGQTSDEPIELSRITWQITPNLDLAPARANLAMLEPKLGERDGADKLLSALLESNAGRYDYCLLDCPPHLGLLMKNALSAADDVIIPVDTGYFALHGLTQQLATIELLNERNGRSPAVRVLPNQYDVRTKLGREILAELRKRFGGVVFDTLVNFNTKLKEGASFGQPITEFAPNSSGAKDFQGLAREVLQREVPDVPSADILEHVERLAADAERLLATTTTLVGSRGTGTATASPATSGVAIMPPEDVPALPPVTTTGKVPTAKGPSATPPERARPTTTEEEPVKAMQSLPAKATPPLSVKTTQPPPTTRLQANTIASDASLAAERAEEIDRKIEAIYGVRQEGEVAIFRTNHPDASEVQLAGDFNDWMPHTTPMRRLASGDFEARLRLPKGRYRYRLVIDGRWAHDLNNPSIERNEYGEMNSIVEVPR